MPTSCQVFPAYFARSRAGWRRKRPLCSQRQANCGAARRFLPNAFPGQDAGGAVAHGHGQRCTRPWTTLHTATDDVAHGHGRRCTRPRATDNALFGNGKKARPHGFAPCTYGKRAAGGGKRLMGGNGKRTEDGSPRQTHIKNKRGLLISQVFIVPLPRIMPRVACLRRGHIPTQL